MYKRWKIREHDLWLRSGIIAAEIRNTLRNKKNSKQWKATDFIPGYKEPKPRQMTVKESVDYVAGLNALFGGYDLRQKVG